MLDAEQLFRQAREGALLLTPNMRSSRNLRSRIVQFATDPAEAALVSERVLPWRAWTSHLWRQALLQGWDERILMQPLQERLVWETILDADPEVERNDALLGLCQTAADLLYQYEAIAFARFDTSAEAASDPARFARWFRTFQQHCQRELLLPQAALETALAGHTAAFPAQTIVRCGLAGLPPAQENLLTSFASSGSAVLEARSEPTAASRTLLRCGDERAELRALAEHLSASLASPTRPSVAIVVPDLSSARDRIDRTLREHLQSATVARSFTRDRNPLWEFSTGRPLASLAVIADALYLLAWSVRDLDGEEVSRVLRSPHLQWPLDAEAVASLEAALLRRKPHLSGTWSARSVARMLAERSPALAGSLTDCSRLWQGLRSTTSNYGSFVERARHVLRDCGWLRSGERSSAEFQAVKRFESLLDELAALDVVSAAQPAWPEFVHRLTAAARSTRFAPENTGAPVQILTPDESTGLYADELWFLHADESRWSSYTPAHPLLPSALQRRFGMPSADPALDQLRHREQTERIAGIASRATFSFAESGESGDLRPSAVVAALPSLQHSVAGPSGAIAQLQASAELERFEDGELIPVALSENMGPISGGVSTLQSQAACAFRAFAERRLGSAGLDSRDLGMDARDRGSLLHNALQIFWQHTQTSDNLHSLIAEDRLNAQIHRAVDLALRGQREPGDPWTESYLEIQRTRLESLMLRWLRKEAERPPFRIAHLEREVTVTVGGLPLKVRVDRVDTVTLPELGTAHVIVDYKTGDPSARKWEGDRPDEPQLPLYATSAVTEIADSPETPVGAIAFGVVRAGDKLNFVTAPRNSAWLVAGPKANAITLDGEMKKWRNTLTTLAEEFRSGIAAVGPKEYPATCRYCEQRLLCRLKPALLDAEESAEVDG
ncbi:PD-(D/E)XK nuclease family protein [Terriglobus aquaticus]|uniref:PD-(D/E)XK nuclease family protein n=1 Tax=Terriglobus aquaticus TaxID=940139 RepID=A0ABW9KIH1_9BACT|nr:PD-(D/E)XK nuclease family protein [Terriglobus aquaticus]